jgi:hypothetical protein
MTRERIDHGHAHAVQTAREAVVVRVELAAGMELGEDDLNPRAAFLRMDVDRHPRPSSSTSSEPSAWSVTEMRLAWPARASSTLLSMTS